MITNGGADLTYTPDADYCNTQTGGDPRHVHLHAGPGGSTATVSVTVTCVADTPVAVDDTATVAEDAPRRRSTCWPTTPMPRAVRSRSTAVTQPANGTVVITGGGTASPISPNANYCNDPPGRPPDTFTYTLTPGGSTATVTVTVTCVGDTPVAVDDTATVAEDAAATTIDVLANDVDPDPVASRSTR